MTATTERDELEALMARRGSQGEADISNSRTTAGTFGQQRIGVECSRQPPGESATTGQALDGTAVLEQQVDVEAVAAIGRNTAGRGVRLLHEALLLETRQDAPDRRRRHAQGPRRAMTTEGTGSPDAMYSRTSAARMRPNAWNSGWSLAVVQ